MASEKDSGSRAMTYSVDLLLLVRLAAEDRVLTWVVGFLLLVFFVVFVLDTHEITNYLFILLATLPFRDKLHLGCANALDGVGDLPSFGALLLVLGLDSVHRLVLVLSIAIEAVHVRVVSLLGEFTLVTQASVRRGLLEHSRSSVRVLQFCLIVFAWLGLLERVVPVKFVDQFIHCALFQLGHIADARTNLRDP